MPKLSILHPILDGMKKCSRCGHIKDTVDFPLQNGRPRADCKVCAVDAERTRIYGISKQDYLTLFKQQNGLCAVCFKPEITTFRGKLKQLSVDHHHITGKVRGLLCSKCNTALGLLKEDQTIIQSLAKYLIDA